MFRKVLFCVIICYSSVSMSMDGVQSDSKSHLDGIQIDLAYDADGESSDEEKNEGRSELTRGVVVYGPRRHDGTRAVLHDSRRATIQSRVIVTTYRPGNRTT